MGRRNFFLSLKRLTATARLVKFEHTVFALPFVLSGAWIAAKGVPGTVDLILLVLAAVFARTAAMGWNRLVDLPFDSANPRTASRELITGALSVSFVKGLVMLCALGFLMTSFLLSPLCGWLSFPVLVVLLGYSYLKRFTFLCHAGLGVALGLAPAGAWLAVMKGFAPGWDIPLLLGCGCALWTVGFDVLYAIQDVDADRAANLQSVPSRWGVDKARLFAGILHGFSLLMFFWLGFRGEFSQPYFLGVGGCLILILLQHVLLLGGRLSRIPLLFFRVNSWFGVVFFAGVVADIHFRSSFDILGP